MIFIFREAIWYWICWFSSHNCWKNSKNFKHTTNHVRTYNLQPNNLRMINHSFSAENGNRVDWRRPCQIEMSCRGSIVFILLPTGLRRSSQPFTFEIFLHSKNRAPARKIPKFDNRLVFPLFAFILKTLRSGDCIWFSFSRTKRLTGEMMLIHKPIIMRPTLVGNPFHHALNWRFEIKTANVRFDQGRSLIKINPILLKAIFSRFQP